MKTVLCLIECICIIYFYYGVSNTTGCSLLKLNELSLTLRDIWDDLCWTLRTAVTCFFWVLVIFMKSFSQKPGNIWHALLILSSVENCGILSFYNGMVHSVQQKSSGLVFHTSRSRSDVTYSCHHNSSRFTFLIFVHSWRSSVFRSLQSITHHIY
jgi:hypothetical protein